MLKTINSWLAKPQGRYREGVEIFKACASSEIKKKYLDYFRQVKNEPEQFDQHFTMLVNKICAIRDKIRLNPDKYTNVPLLLVQKQENEEELRRRQEEIESLKSEIEDLESEIEELESDAGTNREEIEAKEAEIETLEERLEALGAEFQGLKERRGVQIVHHDSLPDDIRARYDRVREITPLMASLHAEVADPKLSVIRRKKLVGELVALDDERRAAWDAIDDWAEGKTNARPDEKRETSYADDAMVRGAQMARRMERLKENIANSQRVADETDREVIRANALKRMAVYQTELDALAEQLKEVQPADVTNPQETTDC